MDEYGNFLMPDFSSTHFVDPVKMIEESLGFFRKREY